jgi:hypothetical protein
MIACSPHDKESYAADIAQVWTIVIWAFCGDS